jgi:hypothetical protein
MSLHLRSGPLLLLQTAPLSRATEAAVVVVVAVSGASSSREEEEGGSVSSPWAEFMSKEHRERRDLEEEERLTKRGGRRGTLR